MKQNDGAKCWLEYSIWGMKLVEENRTRSIIGAFLEVYNTLGFGFLEKVYQNALERELRQRSHKVDREVLVDVCYKGERLAQQRIDMIVDGLVVVEVKSPSCCIPPPLGRFTTTSEQQPYKSGCYSTSAPNPASTA